MVTVLRQLELLDIADSFFPDVARGQRDLEQAAEDYIEDELSPALQGISLGGSIALAFAVVMISLNAMRAGLLSRFMGILGIFVGDRARDPAGRADPPALLVRRTRAALPRPLAGGRGPAWETGEAIAWPGAAAQREEMERQRAEEAGVPEPPPSPTSRTTTRPRLAQAAQEAPLRRQAPTSWSAGTGRPMW